MVAGRDVRSLLSGPRVLRPLRAALGAPATDSVMAMPAIVRPGQALDRCSDQGTARQPGQQDGQERKADSWFHQDAGSRATARKLDELPLRQAEQTERAQG